MDDRKYVAARDSARKILAELDPVASAADIAATAAEDNLLRQASHPVEIDPDESEPIAAISKDLRADIKHLRALLKSGELDGRDKKLIKKALNKVRAITNEPADVEHDAGPVVEPVTEPVVEPEPPVEEQQFSKPKKTQKKDKM